MVYALLTLIIICLVFMVIKTKIEYSKLKLLHSKMIHDLANNISILDSSYEMSFGEFSETEFPEDINKRKRVIESSIRKIYDLIKKG